MTDKMPKSTDRQRHMALARWDSEGGAGPGGPQEGITRREVLPDVPPLTNAEVVQLRVRVIALENLVISLLADASDRQLEYAREMAAYILPRPGVTITRLPTMLPRIWSILLSEPNIFGLTPTTDAGL